MLVKTSKESVYIAFNDACMVLKQSQYGRNYKAYMLV